MNLVIVVLQIIILISGYWLVDIIKKIPDQIYKRNLESFKSELQKEVEKLKISEGNLHIRKIEKFSQFTELINIALTSVKQKPAQNSQKMAANLEKAMNIFTKDIMFFAGEGTLKKFVEYRRYSNIVKKGGENEKFKFNIIIAELIIEMRKDLGYEDNVTVDDYMHILMNDWDENKEEFLRKAKQAKKI